MQKKSTGEGAASSVLASEDAKGAPPPPLLDEDALQKISSFQKMLKEAIAKRKSRAAAKRAVAKAQRAKAQVAAGVAKAPVLDVAGKLKLGKDHAEPAKMGVDGEVSASLLARRSAPEPRGRQY